MKIKIGRPLKPEKDRKTNTLRIRLTMDQRKVLERVAGVSVSKWAREILLEAAR